MENLQTTLKPTLYKDDLKAIHGIGPGIEKRLHNSGLITYAQLASMTPDKIYSNLDDLIGITVKRIIDQNWIGQARDLAEQDATDDLLGDDVRQHYATYTVEFLVNEDNSVRKTNITFIQGKTQDTWSGWNSDRLVDFFIQSSGFSTPKPELETPKTEGIPLTKRTLEIEPQAYDLHLQDIQIIDIETGHAGRVLLHEHNFEVRLDIDITNQQVAEDADMTYTAHLRTKKLNDGSHLNLGLVEGGFQTADLVEIPLTNLKLEEQGLYRLTIDLAFGDNNTNLTAIPTQQFDGGLVLVA